jgi:hypothetical protein
MEPGSGTRRKIKPRCIVNYSTSRRPANRRLLNSLCRPPESLRFWNGSHLQTREERNHATGRAGYLAQGLSEFGSKIMQMCTSDMTSGVGKTQI